MPKQRISLSMIKDVIRLKWHADLSHEQIATTLKVSKGAYTPSSTKVTYRWLRNGASIKGATSSGYTLTSADRGKKVSVKVTLTKSGYTTRSYTTARTSTVS